jgi:alanine racemase
MDYIMIFTGNDKIPSGAKVHILSEAGPDAWEWARAADTIPFEVLTRLSNRVVREYSRDEGLGEAPQYSIQ